MKSCYTQTNNIRLHYLDSEGDKPVVLLMHGLTANAHAFDAILKSDLIQKYRVILVDLRGRGLSDKPEMGYSMEAHALDIIGLMDNLKLKQIVMGGHSFGGLMTLYITAKYPERVSKIILIDAAMQMHPDTKDLLKPAMSRLDQTFESWEAYLGKIKQAPYIGNDWDDEMLSYYEADVETLEDGKVKPRPGLMNMAEAVTNVLAEEWLKHVEKIDKPAVLINAVAPYGLADAPALLPENLARETVALLKDCKYVQVWGNHQTMMYKQGAQDIAKAIINFIG